jgi:hypothetical protein
MCIFVSIPLFALGINVAAQIIAFRCLRGAGLLKSELRGFICGFVSLIIFEIYQCSTLPCPEGFIFSFICDFIIYTLLGYNYFHFVNLGETARRIRILREIYESEDGLSADEVLARYNASEVISRRITRLLDNCQVVFKEGRYYIGKPTVLGIAKGIQFLRAVIFAGSARWFAAQKQT